MDIREMDLKRFEMIASVMDELFPNGRTFTDSGLSAIDKYVLSRLSALRAKCLGETPQFWEESAQHYLDQHNREIVREILDPTIS
jgi:hypothetical protein